MPKWTMISEPSASSSISSIASGYFAYAVGYSVAQASIAALISSVPMVVLGFGVGRFRDLTMAIRAQNAELRRQMAGARPVVYLGGSNDLDLVLDLAQARRDGVRPEDVRRGLLRAYRLGLPAAVLASSPPGVPSRVQKAEAGIRLPLSLGAASRTGATISPGPKLY